MRRKVDHQTTLEFMPMDPKTKEFLEKMDEILKANSEVLDRVAEDLAAGADPDNGRPGMSAEQVLRVAIAKQLFGWGYQVLFHRIDDSFALRRFCRYEYQRVHKPSTLHENVKKLSPQTLEAVHHSLVRYAEAEGIEPADRLRVDTTAVETDIHHPTDSSLIEDAVRVICRILTAVRREFPRAGVVFHNRTRVVKKRAYAIAQAKGQEQKERLYRELLEYAVEVRDYGRDGAERLAEMPGTREEREVAEAVAAELSGYVELLDRIIDQTHRRVIEKEKVPASEKVVSIFEDHTDIIEKGGRETVFGHKLCLSLGEKLVLDCQVQRGNPADSELYRPALDRHMERRGEAPEALVGDGGFASQENLRYAESRGVHQAVFPKRLGQVVKELFPSDWVRRKLLRFRAGCEGMISGLKRGVGLGRCLWRGWKSFQSYVWTSVIAYNLKMMVRALLERAPVPAQT